MKQCGGGGDGADESAPDTVVYTIHSATVEDDILTVTITKMPDNYLVIITDSNDEEVSSTTLKVTCFRLSLYRFPEQLCSGQVHFVARLSPRNAM